MGVQQKSVLQGIREKKVDHMVRGLLFLGQQKAAIFSYLFLKGVA